MLYIGANFHPHTPHAILKYFAPVVAYPYYWNGILPVGVYL
jgi:hypothetical protein